MRARPEPEISQQPHVKSTWGKILFGGIGGFVVILVIGVILLVSNEFGTAYGEPLIIIIVFALVVGVYAGVLVRLIFWNPVSRWNAALVGVLLTTATGVVILLILR